MGVNEYINTVSILRAALAADTGLRYRILSGRIAEMIRAGTFAQGEKLPTHRQLSFDLGVTPGTVSKAYADLARIGLVTGRVGGGTFVRSDLEAPDRATFRTYSGKAAELIDMSVNLAIPLDIATPFRAALDVLGRDPQSLANLQNYAPETGYEEHRIAGARWIGHGVFEAQPERIVITNGAQHALFCSLLALVRQGDVVATDRFTYPGLIAACRALGVRLVGLDYDNEGLTPEALETACRLYKIAALYCTPTIQNPTTGVMSLRRREDIARICVLEDILILEDQAHAVLVEDRPPPLAQFAPDHALILSSLSKAVASGLRAGFVHAPERLVPRIGAMVRSSCWMATPLPLDLATHWISTGLAFEILARQRQEIRRRKALVAPLLRAVRYRTHPDSSHFWIETQEPWRASEVCAHLRRNGCIVASAEPFAVDRDRSGQFVRASVSLLADDDAQLLAGFSTLARTLEAPETLSGII